jgi:O-acetyl-ADP-ribose deacetylase (regulator of RNase III)
MKLHLIDLNDSIVNAAKEIEWNIELHSKTNINTIPLIKGTCFISPANSLGYMDGGFDYVLSRIMFPKIEAKLKKLIKDLGTKTLLGRPFLQIGKALTIETQVPDVFLIASPTMWLPQDVRGTNNAYHAMYAVLKEASSNPLIKDIYFTGFCTGYGKLEPRDAIEQMKLAHDDFLNNKPAKYSEDEIIEEQLKYYMNTEFKLIAPFLVV